MNIDQNRPDWAWITPVTINTMKRGYLQGEVTDENAREKIIERALELVDIVEKRHKRKMPWLAYGIRRGWLSPASPMWANLGTERGLPISCNGTYMSDNMESILAGIAEIGQMTQKGAGTSVYMSNLRAFDSLIRGGGKSQGPVHFAALVQETVNIISQAGVRRGSCAAYFDIEHPDIEEVLRMRSITDGVQHKIQDLSFGVCVSDAWMLAMLSDPKGSPKRKLWAKVINKRRASGYPYIFFTDAANDNAEGNVKRFGLKVHASNLCTEICLPSSDDYSFVCDLSSANLVFWNEWKNTGFVGEIVYMLDAAMSEYIDKTETYAFMQRARRFAIDFRAIGIGVLGWHSFLQSQNIPFESDEADALNEEIHRTMYEQALRASEELAERDGECLMTEGLGRRHYRLMAIAPTQSSSIILGQVSQSTEALPANIYENDHAKGSFIYKNPFLKEVLTNLDQDTDETWASIAAAGGSVQHLHFLDDHVKAVFKTAAEIDQKVVVQQAITRQPWIDQGQSLNITLPIDASMKDDADLLEMGWRGGLKSFYYRRGLNAAQEAARKENACVACEA